MSRRAPTAARPIDERVVVRVLQTLTGCWLAVGIALLITDTRVDLVSAVVIPCLPAVIIVALELATTTNDPPAQPSRDRPALDDATHRDATVASVAPRAERRPDPSTYPRRAPNEVQCPHCGNVFTAPGSGDPMCPVCSTTWFSRSPNGSVPDVLVRSWLHN